MKNQRARKKRHPSLVLIKDFMAPSKECVIKRDTNMIMESVLKSYGRNRKHVNEILWISKEKACYSIQ